MPVELTKTDEQLRQEFFALQTPRDVARLLEVSLRTLSFFLRRRTNYATFDIAKKSGQARTISAPVTGLKIIQRKLNQVLRAVYKKKAAVHGFVPGQNILSNATEHVGRKYVFNVDLADFFPSINFGRVRGLFMATPYARTPEVATVIARICCYENALPQGAPTSPIISNMICAKMDSQLTRLAQKYRVNYTRYADDISISSSKRIFPKGIAFHEAVETGNQLQPGSELEEIVTGNGFRINPKKVRLQFRDQRQQVTGLTVNVRPNVNRKLIHQVRAMLHSWRAEGLTEAERKFRTQGDKKHRNRPDPVFQKVVLGKIDFIGFIKGRDNTDYARLLWKYCDLEKKYRYRSIIAGERAGRVVVSEAVWVLESNAGQYLQGTAFFLNGYGLATCAHVLEAGTMAFHPSRPTSKYSVTVVAKDDHLDLALLSIPVQPRVQLIAADQVQLAAGENITLMGFPQHREGQTVNIERGEITGSRVFQTIREILISPLIVQGSSGGPVLDLRNRVIGIAFKGPPDNADGVGKQMSIVRSIEHLKSILPKQNI